MMSLQSTEQLSPVQYDRRSQLYRRHLDARATFKAVASILAVDVYSTAGSEAEKAAHLGLADLSTHPRVGFKGRGAPRWLEQQKAELSSIPHYAVQQSDGSLIARLSEEEFLILSDLDIQASLAGKMQEHDTPGSDIPGSDILGSDIPGSDIPGSDILGSDIPGSAEKVYLLPRHDSHCWLALTGNHASACLAKLCAIDMRINKFENGEVAQTSLARVNAIILRHDLGRTPCFYILSDVSSTEFLWDSLLDAMQEFEGMPVGMAALKELSKSD